ncbi:MAG: LytTR family DNA-binding domain-containing protein [Saprospiraceae bacterium]
MRTVIIEDEINAFEYLADLAKEVIPEMVLLQHLDSVEDAINWLYKNKDNVDLIFLDIQLSDGLSFEIFNHVDVQAPIIFTTAFDDYAIKAFKLNSVDYLLKPISKEDLQGAVNNLNQVDQSNRDTAVLQNIYGGLNHTKRNRFLVKKGSHFEFVNVKDVSFIYSEDSLTFLHMIDGRRHLYSQTVAYLDRELDATTFIQINRKQIVNINSVKKIYPYLNQRLKLDLGRNDGGLDFIVSRNRAMEFKQWVDK